MHYKLDTNILRLSIKMPPKAVARVLRVHARPHRRRVQRQLDAVLEHVEVPAVFAVVVCLRSMCIAEGNDKRRS